MKDKRPIAHSSPTTIRSKVDEYFEPAKVSATEELINKSLLRLQNSTQTSNPQAWLVNSHGSWRWDHYLPDKTPPTLSLFAAGGEKTTTLQQLHDTLLTISPTSVEAELVFSASGLFLTKIRCRVQTEWSHIRHADIFEVLFH